MALLITPTTGVRPSELRTAQPGTLTLAEAQAAIGGTVEIVDRHGSRFMLADEDGISKRLQPNFTAAYMTGKPILGNVIITDDREFL